jgi:topoisomerase-4 subunit A
MMEQLFIEMYKQYGDYVNKMRMIPFVLDGLRPVERRVLFASYLEAKDRFKKSANIVGKAIVLHPHGDSSIYGTLTKLVRNGFLEGQGNWGSRSGIEDTEPAAMRYTEAKMTKETIDLFFKYIDYVDYDTIEIEEEPLYLSALLPAGLLLEEVNSGIAFGLKTTIPSFEKKDLVKRLLGLLDGKNITIKPHYPNIECLNDETECEKLLQEGEGTFKFVPKIDIDKLNRAIIIKGKPINGNFNNLISSLGNEIDNGIIAFLDKSTKNTLIEIKINKNRKYDFDKLVKLVEQKLTNQLTFKNYIVDTDGNVKLMSIDSWLLKVYDNFKRLFVNKTGKDIEKIDNKIKELDVIKKIRPYIREYLKEEKIEIDTVIDELSTKVNEEKDIIKTIIDKYNIKNLLTIKTDIDKLEEDKKILVEKLSNVEKELIHLYKNL